MRGKACACECKKHKHKNTCQPRSGNQVGRMNLVRRTRWFRVGEDVGQVLLGRVCNHLRASYAQPPHALSVGFIYLLQVHQIRFHGLNGVEPHHAICFKGCISFSVRLCGACCADWMNESYIGRITVFLLASVAHTFCCDIIATKFEITKIASPYNHPIIEYIDDLWVGLRHERLGMRIIGYCLALSYRMGAHRISPIRLFGLILT